MDCRAPCSAASSLAWRALAQGEAQGGLVVGRFIVGPEQDAAVLKRGKHGALHGGKDGRWPVRTALRAVVVDIVGIANLVEQAGRVVGRVGAAGLLMQQEETQGAGHSSREGMAFLPQFGKAVTRAAPSSRAAIEMWAIRLFMAPPVDENVSHHRVFARIANRNCYYL